MRKLTKKFAIRGRHFSLLRFFSYCFVLFVFTFSFQRIIIKITISSIVIGLKNSQFPLIHLSSCYWTVCYWTVCYKTVCYRTVQQPITFKAVVDINQSHSKLQLSAWVRALAFVFLAFNCRQEARWAQNVYISFVGILLQISFLS